MEHMKKTRLDIQKQRLADRMNRPQDGSARPVSLWTDSDFPIERLLKHMETNPLGQLLKLIATLPDVRYDKIAHAREQLSLSEEQLDARLDIALDRVFEELTTEG